MLERFITERVIWLWHPTFSRVASFSYALTVLEHRRSLLNFLKTPGMLVLLVFSSPCLKKKTEWLTRASIDALPLYSLCAEQYCNVLKRNRRVFPERIDYIFLFCVSSSQKLHFPSSFSFSRVIASVKAEFYLTDLLSDTVISLFPKKYFPYCTYRSPIVSFARHLTPDRFP